MTGVSRNLGHLNQRCLSDSMIDQCAFQRDDGYLPHEAAKLCARTRIVGNLTNFLLPSSSLRLCMLLLLLFFFSSLTLSPPLSLSLSFTVRLLFYTRPHCAARRRHKVVSAFRGISGILRYYIRDTSNYLGAIEALQRAEGTRRRRRRKKTTRISTRERQRGKGAFWVFSFSR